MLSGSHAEAQLPAPTYLRARRGFAGLQLRALWSHRDLLWLLAARDVKVRYKQAVLGAMWALIQPIATMVVLHLFFGRLLDMEERVAVPYPIFLFAGLLPWNLFASSVTAASNALVANAAMVRKVYFPRLIVPIASTGAPVVDFLLALGVLFGMMLWFGTGFGPALLLLPFLAASMMIAVLGVGLMMSAITVAYRDFRHLLPFMIQLLFFLTPVIYPSNIVPERFHAWLALNPMQGVIEAFRAAVLNQPINYAGWGISTASALVFLAIGLSVFQRVERRFADII